MQSRAFGLIKSKLESGPKSIRKIADKDFNWRTAQKYLEILEELKIVFSVNKGNKRIYYLYDRDNFFKIPISRQKKDLISEIFAKLKKFSPQITKTQAHKSLFELNNKFNLKLPVGWYLYGPICLAQFKGDEQDNAKLTQAQALFLKQTSEKYSKIDNFKLEDQIYEASNNKLYQLKKLLLDKSFEKNVNLEMMDLIKLAPEQTKDLVTDYARAVMLIGWNHKTKELFNIIWKYIAIVNFKNDIKQFYDYDIEIYFKQIIEEVKSEASKILTSLVTSYGDQKHSQEALYQRFVQHKK